MSVPPQCCPQHKFLLESAIQVYFLAVIATVDNNGVDEIDVGGYNNNICDDGVGVVELDL